MNLKMIGILLQVLVAGTLVTTVGCNKAKKSSNSPAPSADAQKQECEARGSNYRWENNQCVQVKSDEQLCNERQGYSWQNGQCVQEQLTPQQQCERNGGQWVNNTCVGGNNINQLQSCQNINTIPGAFECINVRANEMEAYLRTRNNYSWYNDVQRDIETIKEKNVELKSLNIQSTQGLTWTEKQRLCWDLRTLTNQRAQISYKLRTLGDGELERAEAYLNNYNTAVEYTKQFVGCSVIY